ncbi:TPA: helix-turn-helix transcriptional regulator [Salmonella enterica]|nr:helix-turn-helix transcriptional regulator [Salmonella enterica]HDC2288509.1 helix-turn-helix transcriptional regulator [Salmonella enterica]
MLKDVLREKRKSLRLKQSEVAERIGVTTQTYMKWENGIYEPKVSYISKIAKVLEITEKEICNGEITKENVYNTLDFIEKIERMEKALGKTKTLATIYKYIDNKEGLFNELDNNYEGKIEELLERGIPGYYPEVGLKIPTKWEDEQDFIEMQDKNKRQKENE